MGFSAGWEPQGVGQVQYISHEQAAESKRLDDLYETAKRTGAKGTWEGEPRWDVVEGWYYMNDFYAYPYLDAIFDRVWGPFSSKIAAGPVGEWVA